MKPGPGVSTGLLPVKTGSWNLVIESRDPRVAVRSLVGEEVLDIVGHGVQGVSELVLVSQSPACLGARSGVLWAGCRIVVFFFLPLGG